MNDLGLVSVLPPSIIIALIILNISFCLTLRQPQMRMPVILLHIVLLVFMLYGITALVEAEPSFSWVYRHAGYTEYIMRTGSVDPTLDTYFNWPGFFILNAFVARIADYHTILSYAAWTPVFFNLIYLGPLYMIFCSATTNRRQVWLGLWFFALSNWIEQDSFVPQGLSYFMYLVIIAILLKWFKAPPTVQPSKFGQRLQHLGQRLGRFSPFAQWLYEWLTARDMLYIPYQPRQYKALLVILVIIFAFIVFSHPLTPFFMLASVTALVFFRRCTLWWLPILMAIMTGAWIMFMTQAFLVGHSQMVIGDFGQISSNISSNVTSRTTQGNPEHIFIVDLRVIMTVAIWGLAFLGGVHRLRRGHRDITYILLAIAPFPLFVAQAYGGEMVLRIYLFSLPLMVFFIATLFYNSSTSRTLSWGTIVMVGINVVLLGCFLFTRYGNERSDYITSAEFDGIHYLYSIAPPHSLFLADSGDNTPWLYQDYEKYSTYSMVDVLPDAVISKNVDAIVQFIEREKSPAAYLIFTRSQKATYDALSGLPPGGLDRLEEVLLKSSKFKMIYNNPDAQIFEYVPYSMKQKEIYWHKFPSLFSNQILKAKNK